MGTREGLVVVVGRGVILSLGIPFWIPDLHAATSYVRLENVRGVSRSKCGKTVSPKSHIKFPNTLPYSSKPPAPLSAHNHK